MASEKVVYCLEGLMVFALWFMKQDFGGREDLYTIVEFHDDNWSKSYIYKPLHFPT
jgi:hypothetical protein